MWLEILVDGGIVTFTNVGTQLDSMGRDQRCLWAAKIEAEARRICGKTDEVVFQCEKGDLSVRLHKDAVLAVVRAIGESVEVMPVEIRGFYQKIAYLVEKGERVRLIDLPRG